ncbi:MAG: LssY C-terminal domain-containing protein [Deltaproteobacteria bacterium]|nr:LssY C-terminal domain-containing protein [Deltaproteobacteria bacterium]
MTVAARTLLAFSAYLLLAGCATFSPDLSADTPFIERAQTLERGGLSVSVAVPTRAESKRYFGADVGSHGVQPVWLRVANDTPYEQLFMPISMDPDYHSPAEVAWKAHHFMRAGSNRAMDEHFARLEFPTTIRAGETTSGFVYTNSTLGVKYLGVDLRSEVAAHRFDFMVEIPGSKLDYHQVDFDSLYDADEIRDVDEAGLRAALEALPCCVLGGDKETPGDPANIVVVAPPEALGQSFLRRGWHVTETIRTGTVFGTIASSLFGRSYKNSPISSLYMFGRPQDIALQKARDTVDERNHLRLWLTPIRYQGMEVFVGQISRDIGVRMSSKTFVTHKIDPDVDAARYYLVQDLANSGGMSGLAYVKGVGAANRNEPRFNYTRDAYFTDGLRAVHILGFDHVNIEEIEVLDWEKPADYDELRDAE